MTILASKAKRREVRTSLLLTMLLPISIVSAEAGNNNTRGTTSSTWTRNAAQTGGGPASPSSKAVSKGPLKLQGVKGESMDDRHHDRN